MDFSAFEKVRKDQWIDKITADLKGKSIDTLDWVINESLVVSPFKDGSDLNYSCLLYTSPSPRDGLLSRMPSSA